MVDFSKLTKQAQVAKTAPAIPKVEQRAVTVFKSTGPAALPAAVRSNFALLAQRAAARLLLTAVEKDWKPGEVVCMIVLGIDKPGTWAKISFIRVHEDGTEGAPEQRIAPQVLESEVMRYVEGGSTTFLVMYKGRAGGGQSGKGYHNFSVEPLDGTGVAPADPESEGEPANLGPESNVPNPEDAPTITVAPLEPEPAPAS